MKIDFRKIEVTDIEGNKSTFDISKELGNTIYKNTPDLGELDFAQAIYKQGEVEINEEKAEAVRKYMDVGQLKRVFMKNWIVLTIKNRRL